jgi:hypothetical protein
VRTARSGRKRAIEVLRDDASGLPYVHPAELDEPYLQLPHDYWWMGWHKGLRLPGKVTLLIALSLQARNDAFELPVARGGAWYGLSAGTVSRGLRELRESGLLWMSSTRRDTDLSPLGYAYDRKYELRDLRIVGRKLRAMQCEQPTRSTESRSRSRRDKPRATGEDRGPLRQTGQG